MTEESTIRSIRHGGMRLQLMDGSRWETEVGDHTLVLAWQSSNRVNVDEEPDDESYPYRITNLDTSTPDVVRVKPNSLVQKCCAAKAILV